MANLWLRALITYQAEGKSTVIPFGLLSINNNFSILFDLLLTQMICTVSPANIFTVTNQAVYYQIDFVLKKFKSSSLH